MLPGGLQAGVRDGKYLNGIQFCAAEGESGVACLNAVSRGFRSVIADKVQEHILTVGGIGQGDEIPCFIQSYLPDVGALLPGKGIGVRELHGDGGDFCGKRGGNLRRPVGGTVVLIQPVDGGKVMVAGLHGPDFVSAGGERLCAVALHTDVRENRAAVFVQCQASGVVVVVVIVVVACLDGKTERVIPADKQPDARIENILRRIPGQRRLSVRKGADFRVGKGVQQPVPEA